MPGCERTLFSGSHPGAMRVVPEMDVRRSQRQPNALYRAPSLPGKSVPSSGLEWDMLVAPIFAIWRGTTQWTRKVVGGTFRLTVAQPQISKERTVRKI